LLRANADLTPAMIARAIAQRLSALGVDADVQARMDAQLAILDAKEKSMQALALGAVFVTHNVAEYSRVPGLAVEDWSHAQ
jgi:hypothetical protein